MIPIPLIIILAVLLVLALATPLFSPFYRGRKLLHATPETEEGCAPPISIVIVEHDSAFRLEKTLPKFLSQNYAGDFQVVVVIDQNDLNSQDVISNNIDPHLYCTTLPVTSRYLSRKKLGITLGMRAAKYDWVVVTDVHCAPTSDDWLTHFSRHCTAEKKMVLGMTPYEDDAPAYFRFEHLRTMLYHLLAAQKGMAFSTNQSMVAIRKSEFFQQRGFSGNLEYTRAEFDFLVNKFAEDNATAVAIDQESWLQQYNPNPKRRMGRQLFSLDAMKSMQRKGWFKFWSYLDNDLIHIFNLMTILFIFFLINVVRKDSEVFPLDSDTMILDYILIASTVLIWFISQAVRFFLYRPVLRAFTTINPLVAIILEWTMPFRNIALAIRYRFTDKNDFITHKL